MEEIQYDSDMELADNWEVDFDDVMQRAFGNFEGDETRSHIDWDIDIGTSDFQNLKDYCTQTIMCTDIVQGACPPPVVIVSSKLTDKSEIKKNDFFLEHEKIVADNLTMQCEFERGETLDPSCQEIQQDIDNVPITINQMLEESVIRNYEIDFDEEGVRIGGDGWGRALAVLKEKQAINIDRLDVELTKLEVQPIDCFILPSSTYKQNNGQYLIPDIDILLYRLQLIGISRHVEEICFNEDQAKQVSTRHLDLSIVEQLIRFNDLKFRKENIISIVFPEVLFGNSEEFNKDGECQIALHSDNKGSIIIVFDNPSNEIFVSVTALKVEIVRPTTPGLYVDSDGQTRNLLNVDDDTYMFFRDTDDRGRPIRSEFDIRRNVWCKQSGRWFFFEQGHDTVQMRQLRDMLRAIKARTYLCLKNKAIYHRFGRRDLKYVLSVSRRKDKYVVLKGEVINGMDLSEMVLRGRKFVLSTEKRSRTFALLLVTRNSPLWKILINFKAYIYQGIYVKKAYIGMRLGDFPFCYVPNSSINEEDDDSDSFGTFVDGQWV